MSLSFSFHRTITHSIGSSSFNSFSISANRSLCLSRHSYTPRRHIWVSSSTLHLLHLTPLSSRLHLHLSKSSLKLSKSTTIYRLFLFLGNLKHISRRVIARRRSLRGKSTCKIEYTGSLILLMRSQSNSNLFKVIRKAIRSMTSTRNPIINNQINNNLFSWFVSPKINIFSNISVPLSMSFYSRGHCAPIRSIVSTKSLGSYVVGMIGGS